MAIRGAKEVLGPAGPRFESLRFEEVSHYYEPRSGDRVPTLDRISFTIGANEFVTILGPSGLWQVDDLQSRDGVLGLARGRSW